MKKILFLLLISTVAFAQPYNGAPKLNTTPQGDETGMLVRAIPQDIDRIGFTKTISNNVDTDWGSLVVTGAGMTVNQTGGNLVITSGTTARAETIIRSSKSWLGGIRLRARSTLSQRIINQNFFVEMVDVIGDGLAYNITSATTVVVTIPSNPFTSVNVGQSVHLGAFNGTGTFLGGRYPIASVSGDNVTFTVSGFATGTGTCSVFGWNYYQLRYQGTTATNVDFDTQRNGWNSGFTTATINTTAAPGHLAIITGNDLNAAFADQLVASSGAIAQTVRATRVENVPDDISLRLQVRVQNLGTSPASSTTWTIGLISISKYANQDVVIQDIRPMNVAQALPVEILRSTTQTVTATNLSGNVAQIGGTNTVNGGVAGTLGVGGNVAHSAASTANPLQAGGRIVPTTIATTDATLVAGDVGYLPLSTGSQALTKSFSSAELDYNINFSSVATTTTVQQLVPASGTANIRNYISMITISNDALGAAGNAWILDGALTVSSIATGTGLVTTSTAHDLKIGDAVVFTALATGTGVSTNTVYYVTSVGSTTTFNFSTAIGGSNVVPSVAYTGTTMYRILKQLRFQTPAIQEDPIVFPNPLRGNTNTQLNLLIPSSLTSGTVYLTVNGYRGF